MWTLGWQFQQSPIEHPVHASDIWVMKHSYGSSPLIFKSFQLSHRKRSKLCLLSKFLIHSEHHKMVVARSHLIWITCYSVRDNWSGKLEIRALSHRGLRVKSEKINIKTLIKFLTSNNNVRTTSIMLREVAQINLTWIAEIHAHLANKKLKSYQHPISSMPLSNGQHAITHIYKRCLIPSISYLHTTNSHTNILDTFFYMSGLIMQIKRKENKDIFRANTSIMDLCWVVVFEF